MLRPAFWEGTLRISKNGDLPRENDDLPLSATKAKRRRLAGKQSALATPASVQPLPLQAAATSSSSDGSESSDEEPPPPLMMENEEANSSDDEVVTQAAASKRGTVTLYTWPCPRQYCVEIADRRRQNLLKPSDLSKQETLDLLKEVLKETGWLSSVQQIIIVDEPHRRYDPQASPPARERHKHIVICMNGAFAHASMRKALASKGVHGWFSFSLTGKAAYFSYVLKDTPRKLKMDMDGDPLFWPSMTREKALSVVDGAKPQILNRKGNEPLGVAKAKEEKKPKERTTLTWDEFTNVCAEQDFKSYQDLVEFAKQKKFEHGDTLLWTYLGTQREGKATFEKARKMLHPELLADKTVLTSSDFPLSAFRLDKLPTAKAWLEHKHYEGTKPRVLIMEGEGGLGKTETACAMMASIRRSYHFISKLDQLRTVTVEPDQGLVVDDLRMSSIDVDDVKAWLDCKKPRAVQGRNQDGFIPAFVPRIFCTNWEPAEFFPGEYQLSKQRKTIDRRHRWQKVASDVRILSASALAEEEASSPTKPKPLGEQTELIYSLMGLSPNSRETLFGLVGKLSSSSSSSKAPPPRPPLPTQETRRSSSAAAAPENDDDEDPLGLGGSLTED